MRRDPLKLEFWDAKSELQAELKKASESLSGDARAHLYREVTRNLRHLTQAIYTYRVEHRGEPHLDVPQHPDRVMP